MNSANNEFYVFLPIYNLLFLFLNFLVSSVIKMIKGGNNYHHCFSQAEPNDSISPLNMVFAVIFVHSYFCCTYNSLPLLIGKSIYQVMLFSHPFWINVVK